MRDAEERLPFARMVRERMEERGTGLRELCRAVGLDPSFFSKVLAGKRNPPSDERVLRSIAGELELDPPRVIVAAGRVPSEWRKLWEDDGLFESVHGLATGAADRGLPRGNAAEASGRRWDAAAQPAPVPRPPAQRPAEKEFGEELL